MKGFFDRMKEGAAEAAKYAQQTVEVTRLKAQIAGKEKEVDKYYGAIGERVFQAYCDGDLAASEPFIGEAGAQIIRLREEIAELESRIKEVKQTKECVCGRTLAADAKFCPHCGHRMEEEQIRYIDVPVRPTEVRGNGCPVCGTEKEKDASRCQACGEPFAPPPAPSAGQTE